MAKLNLTSSLINLTLPPPPILRNQPFILELSLAFLLPFRASPVSQFFFLFSFFFFSFLFPFPRDTRELVCRLHYQKQFNFYYFSYILSFSLMKMSISTFLCPFFIPPLSLPRISLRGSLCRNSLAPRARLRTHH